jgi:AraC-like DNA-binding protein
MSPVPPQLKPHVDEYLQSCLASQVPPRVAQLATQLGISRYTLTTRFRSDEGLPLGKYLMRQQIACAKQLLRTTDLPVATIARRAGFASERAFHRAFLRETGTTPAKYRTSSNRTD